MGDLRNALSVLAAGVLLLGFATPLRVLWTAGGVPWWSPFLLWAIAVGALGLAARTSDGGRPGA